MPPETVRGSVGPTVGGDDISFDADGDSGPLAAVPRREPPAAPIAAGGPVAGGPAASTPHGRSAAPAWLFRRVVGLPLMVWACILAATLSAAVCAGVWWLMSGSSGDEGEDDAPMPAVEEKAVTPPPRKQKPAPQNPAQQKSPQQKPTTKSREKQKPASGDGAEPSPLDRMLQPAKPTATPADPAASSEKSPPEKSPPEKSQTEKLE